jgi:hypothetical protein
MKKLLVLLLLLYPLTAGAETYQWTDAGGTVNFTEDLGKVPKKYRKKVKVLGADEGSAPRVVETAAPEKEKPKAKDAGVKQKKALAPKEESTLRMDYAAASANLKATEHELADLRARLADTSKMSRSEFLSLQNTVKQEEYRLQDQKKKQDQLRLNAEKAGVILEMN